MPDPLHPAVVHFPIVFAVLLPFVIVACYGHERQDAAIWVSWIPALVVALLLAISSVAATKTGETEAPVVEAVVSQQILHEHEEAGERLRTGALVTLLLVIVGLVPPLSRRLTATLRALAFVGSLIVLVLAWKSGKSGGELVYEHGAAKAYTELRASGEGDD